MCDVCDVCFSVPSPPQLTLSFCRLLRSLLCTRVTGPSMIRRPESGPRSMPCRVNLWTTTLSHHSITPSHHNSITPSHHNSTTTTTTSQQHHHHNNATASHLPPLPISTLQSTNPTGSALRASQQGAPRFAAGRYFWSTGFQRLTLGSSTRCSGRAKTRGSSSSTKTSWSCE